RDDLDRGAPGRVRPLARRRAPRDLACRERADDVVGLVARGPDARDAERREHVHDHGHLRDELLRDLLDARRARDLLGDAVLLVRRDRLDAERRPPVDVPARDEARGPPVGDERRDHVEQAAHRVDRRAVGGPDRVRHPEERAEVQARGVEEHEFPARRARGGGAVAVVRALRHGAILPRGPATGRFAAAGAARGTARRRGGGGREHRARPALTRAGARPRGRRRDRQPAAGSAVQTAEPDRGCRSRALHQQVSASYGATTRVPSTTTAASPASTCADRVLNDWYAARPGATPATSRVPNGVSSTTSSGASPSLSARTVTYAVPARPRA